MKRFIVFFAVMALIIAMLGCAVNSTTGRIIVSNNTTKAATDVKVGTVYIGYVGSGQTTTIYFSTNQNTAQITATGFTPQLSTQTGTINLKINYAYSLGLSQNSTGYFYGMYGSMLGDSNISESMN